MGRGRKRPRSSRPTRRAPTRLSWTRSAGSTSATVAYVQLGGRALDGRHGAADARVEDTPILDFINEVQRAAAGADLSATAAFDLGAGIPEGQITVADVAGLYIYDNTLKAVRITGAQLRAYLEKSAEY